jgi:ABC-type polysaccharide/polyol phosphate export permease
MKGIRMEITIARHWRLLWALVKRDLRARYIGSIMGVFWSVVNPLIMLVIYIFIFSLIFQFAGGGRAATPALAARKEVLNYPVFLCCGILPWNAFLEALLGATAVIAASGGLIKKAVFPASILPMQSIAASFVNLTITLLLLSAFLLATGHFPGASGVRQAGNFLMLVPLMALQFIVLVGPCYFFATVNVFFRDIALILTAMMNIAFWLTPVVYPARLVVDRAPWMAWVYFANPLAHLVRLYREFLYEDRLPYTLEVPCPAWVSVLFLLAFGAAAYVVGKYVFTRSQPHFVDEV